MVAGTIAPPMYLLDYPVESVFVSNGLGYLTQHLDYAFRPAASSTIV